MKKREERAKRNPSSDTDAGRLEFLYGHSRSDYSGEYYTSKYRIVRRTKERVFVERDEYDSVNRAHDLKYCGPFDIPTCCFDRDVLERDCKVYSHRHWGYLTTDPNPPQPAWGRSPHLELLGLQEGAGSQDIKRAFRRLAKRHHPDKGGDAERFKGLQAAYEQALGAEAHNDRKEA